MRKGFAEHVIVAQLAIPALRHAHIEEDFLADRRRAAPGEAIVAGTERAGRHRVPDPAHQRPEIRRIGEEPAITGGRADAGFVERRHQRTQPARRGRARRNRRRRAPRCACGSRARRPAGFESSPTCCRLSPLRQHDSRAHGQHARRNVGRGVGDDDQFVIGIVERRQRGQILAQSLVAALDRHDHGGRRQAAPASARGAAPRTRRACAHRAGESSASSREGPAKNQ